MQFTEQFHGFEDADSLREKAFSQLQELLLAFVGVFLLFFEHVDGLVGVLDFDAFLDEVVFCDWLEHDDFFYFERSYNYLFKIAAMKN